MKSTGFVRKVDELGRIAIPMELRRKLEDKDPVEINVVNDQVILRKHRMPCIVTREITSENKSYANGNLVLSSKGEKILLQVLEKIQAAR
ncbi:AbrB/MazE/SpoVT family DNA-binding domain-containing protein [Lysinibacillus xylanilyticus]|uniref:AbrB/MazE/SpoVT family DNA-binding domain-containing protein n=1 Tax=Lysinibacillus xylanilyticus TaxID=582475 RepID=UPI00380E6D95